MPGTNNSINKSILIEKKKMELQAFKDSIVSNQQRVGQHEGGSKSLIKAMTDLKLKEIEIENLKDTLV